MNEKFVGKPIVRDINICKKCKWFKTVNDPIVKDGHWHWGIGVYCGNFPHNCTCGWCAETHHLQGGAQGRGLL